MSALRRAIGWAAFSIERLDWHCSPVKRSPAFWRAYFRVWAIAECVRKWAFGVPRG